MGEYLLYVQGKVVGGIYDNRLLIKLTPSVKALLPDAPEEIPYEGGKTMVMITEPEEREVLCRVVEAAALDLPLPKKRQRNTAAKKQED